MEVHGFLGRVCIVEATDQLATGELVGQGHIYENCLCVPDVEKSGRFWWETGHERAGGVHRNVEAVCLLLLSRRRRLKLLKGVRNPRVSSLDVIEPSSQVVVSAFQI